MTKFNINELIRILRDNGIRIKGNRPATDEDINEFSYLVLEDIESGKEYEPVDFMYLLPNSNKIIRMYDNLIEFASGNDDKRFLYYFDGNNLIFSINIGAYNVTPLTMNCSFFEKEDILKHNRIEEVVYLNQHGESVIGFYFPFDEEELTKMQKSNVSDYDELIKELKENYSLRDIILESKDKIETVISIVEDRAKATYESMKPSQKVLSIEQKDVK